MFPEAFIGRIKKQSSVDSEELLRALEEKPPASVRLNRLKWDRNPTGTDSVPWCRDGFFIGSRPSYTMDPLYHGGCYYPQESSGMFLEEIFRQLGPEPGNYRILDLCGAPGGKSTHLSSLAGKGSLLIANEVIRSRALILAENVTKWGIPNVMVTQSDASAFSRLPGYFDIILADAPCSGEGMFRDTIARNEWSEENAALCSERQKRILMDVWPALKEDGILIYSTCTFNPAENEENIKWLTERKGAETIRLDISEFKEIIEIFNRGIYGYGFYPGKVRGEGFFISVIRKKESQAVSVSNIRMNNNPGISKEEIKVISGIFDTVADRLIKYNDGIIAIPCSYGEYLKLSGSLKIVKPGPGLVRMNNRSGNKNVVPLHDLALSVSYKKEAYPTVDLSLDQAQVYLSRGQFVPDKVQKGWNIVSYDGVNLGFINNIGSRINNYYPMDWRIRMDLRKNRNENLAEWRNGTEAQRHSGNGI